MEHAENNKKDKVKEREAGRGKGDTNLKGPICKRKRVIRHLSLYKLYFKTICFAITSD